TVTGYLGLDHERTAQDRLWRRSGLMLTGAISLVVGAAFGSIPFGFFAGRFRRIDIRRHGSGNIGFTNVQRTIGWAWAVPVLLLDVAKGLVPTALAHDFGLIPPLVGIGAILGHVFCPWLGFNGGKGVATTIGVAAFLCPRSLFVALGVFVLAVLVTGFISASSLALTVALPLLTGLFYRGNTALLVFSVGVAIVIVVRHVANIKRLAAGTEPHLGLWLKLFKKT
ncbi:glycerol-3-phosphate acyltransferase, partial [candidate division WOR-3 bacterium]|nr:glycerol-3-phosphate acyltransferase [candidate division WOR-3 bacterium]